MSPLEPTTYLHRIIVKTDHGVEQACEQLRDAGYEPCVGTRDNDVYGGVPIDFAAPRDERLEFLRPHILPPLEATS